MRYRIYLILLLFALAGCSSGSSTSGGGSNPVTDTGNTGLSVSAYLTVDSISADCWSNDCNNDGNITGTELIGTDQGTVNVTVTDLYNQYAKENQGVTFTSYTITYSGVSPSAPALPSRTLGTTFQIPLDGSSSATATTTVILVELDTTKATFATLNPGPNMTTYSYKITLTFFGKDWVNNENIKMVVTTTMELGNFCPSS